MHSVVSIADDVLRRRRRTPRGDDLAIRSLVGLVVIYGTLYGAAMGSFGGLLGAGELQIIYSGIKVPFLLLATFALSLPSFYVVNSLLGLRRDFADAIRALVATQAGLSVVLASLAPFTLFWYASVDGYSDAILFNAVMFAIASVSAQWILRDYYQPLIRRNPLHRWMLRAWLVVYAFVGIQMGWILRPFIGDPASPVQFFRQDSWGNAYMVVGRMLWRALPL
jgi:hypothetical protein